MEFLEIFSFVNLLNIMIWLYKVQQAHQQYQSKTVTNPEILFSSYALVRWGSHIAWN